MRTNPNRTTLAAIGLAVAFVALVLGGSSLLAAPSTHVMATARAVQWQPAPPVLPAGASIAVLAGNPMGTGPYTVRLKFPANYDIPAHSHPTDENVVVISGDLFMGMGEKLDRTAGTGLGVGGFGLMPAGENHFAYTKSVTTIVLYGQGPVEFKYVNPADDPRRAAATK